MTRSVSPFVYARATRGGWDDETLTKPRSWQLDFELAAMIGNGMEGPGGGGRFKSLERLGLRTGGPDFTSTRKSSQFFFKKEKAHLALRRSSRRMSAVDGEETDLEEFFFAALGSAFDPLQACPIMGGQGRVAHKPGEKLRLLSWLRILSSDEENAFLVQFGQPLGFWRRGVGFPPPWALVRAPIRLASRRHHRGSGALVCNGPSTERRPAELRH